MNIHISFEEQPEIWGFDGSHTPLNGIVGNLFQKVEQAIYEMKDEILDEVLGMEVDETDELEQE